MQDLEIMEQNAVQTLLDLESDFANNNDSFIPKQLKELDLDYAILNKNSKKTVQTLQSICKNISISKIQEECKKEIKFKKINQKMPIISITKLKTQNNLLPIKKTKSFKDEPLNNLLQIRKQQIKQENKGISGVLDHYPIRFNNQQINNKQINNQQLINQYKQRSKSQYEQQEQKIDKLNNIFFRELKTLQTIQNNQQRKIQLYTQIKRDSFKQQF